MSEPLATFHIRLPCEHKLYWQTGNMDLPEQCTNELGEPRVRYIDIGRIRYRVEIPSCKRWFTLGGICEDFSYFTGWQLVMSYGRGSSLLDQPPRVVLPAIDGNGRTYVAQVMLDLAWDDALRERACKGCGRIPTRREWEDSLEERWEQPGFGRRWQRVLVWPNGKSCCSEACFEKWIEQLVEQDKREGALKKARSRSRSPRGRAALQEFLAVGAIRELADQAR